MNYTDDTPKYKKKSKKNPPKKADHKHLHELCVIEYPQDWYNKEHVRSGKLRTVLYRYCPICGKITDTKESAVALEERTRELNPTTRTLPTFRVDSPFAKFVELEEENKN